MKLMISIRVVLLLLCLGGIEAWIDQDRQIESTILKKYNRKHRPVKNEATTMQIEVFLMINHIEKVDEREQTMLLHGQISAAWMDEYLSWKPSAFNNTGMISIETWKIWQPSFALYNSARSNGWYLHMQGVPATVTSEGKVYSSGSFSFYVTCVFDFSDYPYDVQKCPIVIADWVYDLSKINLSEPAPSHLAKPVVRLSFDPDPNENGPKKHVAGWEVQETWRKHCYWGPKGCLEEGAPAGPLDTYWSLLEFGVELKRHAPYFGLTIVLPSLITTVITLMIFWIDDYPMTLAVGMLNILLQGFCSWSLLKELPPGNGKLPRIGYYFGYNLILTALAYTIHSVFQFLLVALPGDIEFPFQLTNMTEKLREMKFFKVEGLSFDPQKVLLGEDASTKDPEAPTDTTPSNTTHSVFVEFEDAPPLSSIETNEESIQLEESNPTKTIPEETPPKLKISNESHLAEELYTIRRIIFAFYLIIFAVIIPWLLF